MQIWSDVMCPWCAIGGAQYARALAEVGDEIEVTTRWMPFELNPDLPPEGKDQQKHLAEVYQRSPEEVAAMRAQMQERAASAGFAMDWSGANDSGGEEPAAWIFSAIAEDPEFLAPVTAHRRRLLARLMEETNDPSRLLVIFLAIEGMRSLKLFDAEILSEEQRRRVVERVLRIARQTTPEAAA